MSATLSHRGAGVYACEGEFKERSVLTLNSSMYSNDLSAVKRGSFMSSCCMQSILRERLETLSVRTARRVAWATLTFITTQAHFLILTTAPGRPLALSPPTLLSQSRSSITEPASYCRGSANQTALSLSATHRTAAQPIGELAHKALIPPANQFNRVKD
ncbi:hypothetical protein SRHO_G00274440 [Serrasalmus rhombeus]